MDDIDIAALFRVMFFCDIRKFRRDAKRFFRIVAKALFCGNRHAAFSDIEVEQLVYLRRIFEQNILPRDAEVSSAPFDIDRDVGRLDPKKAKPLFLIFKNQLASRLPDGGTVKAGALKHTVFHRACPWARQC